MLCFNETVQHYHNNDPAQVDENRRVLDKLLPERLGALVDGETQQNSTDGATCMGGHANFGLRIAFGQAVTDRVDQVADGEGGDGETPEVRVGEGGEVNDNV